MIEDDLRTTLRRRAAAIDVKPPRWADLDDVPAAASSSLAPRRPWLGVAAAILTMGVAAIVLAGRSHDRPEVPVEQVPGPALPFDPVTAAPIPFGVPEGTVLSDPQSAAQAYLGQRLRTENPDEGVAVVGMAVGDDGRTARVPWAASQADPGESFQRDPDWSGSGTVYLRRIVDKPPLWAVVGTTSDGLTVSNSRVRERVLSLDVTPSAGVLIDVMVEDMGMAQLPAPGGHLQVQLPGAGPPTVLVRSGRSRFTEFVVQPEGGPPGGRVILSGTIGDKSWRVWGVDTMEGPDTATPCVVVTVASRFGQPDCGVSAGGPTDQAIQLVWPAATELEDVLFVGVVTADVFSVGVFPGPHDGAETLALPDPGHPAGAKVFAAVFKPLGPTVTLEPHRGEAVAPRVEVRVDATTAAGTAG